MQAIEIGFDSLFLQLNKFAFDETLFRKEKSMISSHPPLAKCVIALIITTIVCTIVGCSPPPRKKNVLVFFDISLSESEQRKETERTLLNPLIRNGKEYSTRFSLFTFAETVNFTGDFTAQSGDDENDSHITTCIENAFVKQKTSKKGTNFIPVVSKIRTICRDSPDESFEVLIITTGGIDDAAAVTTEMSKLPACSNLELVVVGPLSSEPSSLGGSTTCAEQMKSLLAPLKKRGIAFTDKGTAVQDEGIFALCHGMQP